jgi:hypothetical protein
MNRLEAACDAAKQPVQLDTIRRGHYWLGRIWLELGDPQEAVKELAMASPLGPYRPKLHYNLGRVPIPGLIHLSRPNPSAANFGRLNAMLEQHQRMQGSQSYGDASD